MATGKKILFKILKISGISIAITLLLLIVLPIIFADTITEKVKTLANESLEGELNFDDSNLSFFKHFPSLTLTLNEFNLNGSAPFKEQSLVAAKEIGFGIDIPSLLFGSETKIDEIYLNEATINIQVNTKGEANYNIYKSSDTIKSNDESSASLQLKDIQINRSHLIYDDASAKIHIEGKGFNYKGKGNLLESNFSLKTTAKIDSLSFAYDKNEYLKNKKVQADLITRINTNSLAFVFEKNDLIINKLPVEFSGFFNFLANGYEMDFKLKTENSNLEDLFTALPSEYVTWMNQTQMKGKTDAYFTLKGKYIASTNENPNANFNIKVRDGYVKHQKGPYPVKDIYLNLDTKLPSLDINQLKIQLDSLYFNVNENKLSAILKSDGFGQRMQIDTKIKSNLDLNFLSNALQIPNLKIAGKLDSDIVAKGNYDKIAHTFPITKGKFALTNGSIQTAYYPKPIENINIQAQLNCPTVAFKDATFTLTPATFTFENEPFNMSASFKNFDDIEYDIKANGILNLAPIYKVFSQKGLDLNGIIKANVSLSGKQSDATNGNIKNLKNSGTLELENIITTSDYLAKPFLIEKGLFIFNQDKMNFSNFNGKYGQSDITMNGYVLNVINFILSEKETIKGTFDLASQYLNINEFIPATTQKTEDDTVITTPSVIEVPTNLDVVIQTRAQKTQYDDIVITNLNGLIALQKGTITLSNGTLGIVGATAKMKGTYRNEGKEKAYFDYTIKANDFDIKRAYNEIKLFREIATAAENAEGIISLDYTIKGILNKNMEPVFPSLEGNGILSVKKVKMKGFKIMNVVSQKTNNPDIKDPDVSEVDIKSTIKNNLLTVERFKFKVSGFRLRFGGQTSLDGKLNLKMRLGLPPLGLIGIPIKVTGTQDNPKIQLGKKSEDLEETIYEDGVTPLTTPTDSIGITKPNVIIDSTAVIVPAIQNDSIKQNILPLEKENDSIKQNTLPLKKESDSVPKKKINLPY